MADGGTATSHPPPSTGNVSWGLHPKPHAPLTAVTPGSWFATAGVAREGGELRDLVCLRKPPCTCLGSLLVLLPCPQRLWQDLQEPSPRRGRHGLCTPSESSPSLALPCGVWLVALGKSLSFYILTYKTRTLTMSLKGCSDFSSV